LLPLSLFQKCPAHRHPVFFQVFIQTSWGSSWIDRGHANRSCRGVQRSSYSHALVTEILGFLLVVQLISGEVIGGCQDEFISGFHDLSAEGMHGSVVLLSILLISIIPIVWLHRLLSGWVGRRSGITRQPELSAGKLLWTTRGVNFSLGDSFGGDVHAEVSVAIL
jgi:hypothetical protein